MAITGTDVDALPVLTNEQRVKLWLWALDNGAAGQTRTINGRSVSFPSSEEMRKNIEWFESRSNADANDGRALITFNES